jgi:hypothetical protein
MAGINVQQQCSVRPCDRTHTAPIKIPARVPPRRALIRTRHRKLFLRARSRPPAGESARDKRNNARITPAVFHSNGAAPPFFRPFPLALGHDDSRVDRVL